MLARRVLLLDDEPGMGEVVCQAAEGLGMSCEAVTDAPAFFAALNPETELIFLDLKMPGLDGVEVLRLLSQREGTPPVVLMSGMGKRVMQTAVALAAALELRVAGCLLKPFRVAEVEAILRNPVHASAGIVKRNRREAGTSASEFREGLERDQFEVYFQPQVNAVDGRVSGLEALVRWRHPVRGLLSPGQFVPFGEANGLINPMGWVVMRKALAAAGDFAGLPWQDLSISINVAARSLENLSFPERLMAIAAQCRVEPERIVLEITESGLMRDRTQSLDVLTRLRMRGVRLSIDDFGTGYSMMQQLRDVPATELKIDHQLIDTVDSSESVEVMVRKIIELGHELGMRIVAEGVERASQRAVLQRLRCDLLQGYLFCEPLPLAELRRWMEAYSGDRPARAEDANPLL